MDYIKILIVYIFSFSLYFYDFIFSASELLFLHLTTFSGLIIQRKFLKLRTKISKDILMTCYAVKPIHRYLLTLVSIPEVLMHLLTQYKNVNY